MATNSATPNYIITAIKAYNVGVPVLEIITEAQCSRATLYHWLHKAGVPTTRPRGTAARIDWQSVRAAAGAPAPNHDNEPWPDLDPAA